jgi:hydrogenase maturation factor
MNRLYGKVVEVFEEEGLRRGKVRFGGALKIVTLALVADADRGDEVLLCDGTAIGKVRDAAQPRLTPAH